jgi:hypothetical protein
MIMTGTLEQPASPGSWRKLLEATSMSVMEYYSWAALSGRPGADLPAATGISGRRRDAETAAGHVLMSGADVLIARIDEVRCSTDADLQPCHQPTGRSWYARRDSGGGILWLELPPGR